MQLLDLPLELLRNITEQLAAIRPDDHYIWLALSLTNKLLYELAKEHHYYEPWISSQYPDQLGFVQLLRALVENRSLGSFVRILDTESLYLYKTSGTKLHASATRVLDMEMVTSAIHETGVPHAGQWAAAAREGSTDALLTLMLVLLPKLERLHLEFRRGGDTDTTILGLTLRSGLMPKPGSTLAESPLSSLEYAFVDDHWRWRNRVSMMDNTSTALCLFYLPKMKNLTLLLEDPEEFAWPHEQMPNPSQLCSLKLEGFRIPHGFSLISACPALTELDWSLYETDFRAIRRPPLDFNLDTVSTILAGTGSRLTKLELALPFCQAFSVRGNLSVSNLSVLKTMAVDFCLLMPCRNDQAWAKKTKPYFPESLEVLTIFRRKKHYSDPPRPHSVVMETEMIMRHLHTFTPGLRELHLGALTYQWFFRAELETRGRIQGVPVIMGSEPQGYQATVDYMDWRTSPEPLGWRWLAPSTQRFNDLEDDDEESE